MKRICINLCVYIILRINNIFIKVYKYYIHNKFCNVGRNFVFHPEKASFLTPELISIGNNVYIGEQAYFSGRISIGNNVMFGPRTTLLGGNHIFGIKGKSVRFLSSSTQENMESIVIEDEVWVGANVTILGGVTVGIGSVVGAGSVAVKDICPYTVSVGNPCKPVRSIFNDNTLYEHLKAIGYNHDFALDIIEKRKTFFGEKTFPTIDNTNNYKNLAYHIEI